MTATLKITCRDPIVSRDGRPFGVGQGNRMRGLDWLLPSVLAGALRTTLGTLAQRDFSVEVAEDLLRVEVAGPFPVADGQLYLPAPNDCVVDPERKPLRAVPQGLGNGGGDWPAMGLRPVQLQDQPSRHDFKPEEPPAWWPEEHLAAWLAGDDKLTFNEQFLRAPEKVERTHVSLDHETGAAEEGALFTTAALALSYLPRYGAPAKDPRQVRCAEITLAARIRASEWCSDTAASLDSFYPLGGERRLAYWKTAEASVWSRPNVILKALATASRVRMVLATPAIFSDGWKPGWLSDQLIGTPPGASFNLRLVGVSIQRWQAVSGWSLADLPGQPRGPKPIKRMVPSGGVYFFETVDGNAANLADRWLESVSDSEQDRRDGFGLAVWGTW